MATIDLQTFVNIAKPVLAEGYPVLIRGRHGIGKSESAYEIAQGLGDFMGLDVPDLKVVELRASQMNEGDLLGLPFLEDDVTVFKPPSWFRDCQESPCLLVLDELNRASTQVKQALMQLTDSHGLAGKSLHSDTRIVGAVNTGVDYNVADMDPAELDRWVVWDVEPTIEDWILWAKRKVFLAYDKKKGFIQGSTQNVEPVIIDFVQKDVRALEHEGMFEPDQVYPSRRSWKRFSDVVRSSGINLNKKENATKVFNLLTGFVGEDVAIRFREYMINLEQQLGAEDILEGNFKTSDIEKMTIPRQRSAVVRLYASGAMKRDDHERRVFDNIARFLDALSMEMKAHFFARHIDVENEEGLFGSYENFVKLRESLSEFQEGDEDYMVSLASRVLDSDIEDPLKGEDDEQEENG